jgi:hypothetical protein
MPKTPKPKSPKQLAAERAAARKEYALKVSTAMKGRKAKKEKQVNPAAQEKPAKEAAPIKEQATQVETAKQVESVTTKGLEELHKVELAKQREQNKAEDDFKRKLEARKALKGLLHEANVAEIGRQQTIAQQREKADLDMQERLRARENKKAQEKAKADRKEARRIQELEIDVAGTKQEVNLLERDLSKVSNSWGAWIGRRKEEISALQEKLEKAKKERDAAVETLDAAMNKSKAPTQKAASTTRTTHAISRVQDQSKQGRGR